MALEQTMFVGDDPSILVDVIENGSHVAATINTTTTRVEGNSAVPTVTTIGTGNYKISFPGLTPAPAEGDELLVKVNGDIGGTAWSEAVYKLKVLPQVITSMDSQLDTIESTAEDTLFACENDIPQSIFNLNNVSSTDVQTACNTALVDLHLDHLLAVDYDPAFPPGVATALLNELIESDAGVSRFTTNALENAIVGTGSGARTVVVTVNDGTDPLENAIVRITEGMNTYSGMTDSSGQLTFNLDDATYVVAITKQGYSFSGTSLVVSDDLNQTYSMTSTGVATVVRADVEEVFGKRNVAKWADLDRDNNATEIDSRITARIAKAQYYIQAQVEPTTYDWDLVFDHIIIKDLIATQAGLFLYQNRSNPEEADKSNPMRHHYSRIQTVFKAIYNGSMNLGGETRESRPFPAVHDENGDDIST